MARSPISTFLLLCLSAPAFAATLPLPAVGAPARTCDAGAPAVDEQGFVKIGGIEQWLTIKGANCANPVLLFIHGGPGNPMTPYADALYGAWAKDFTLVQWDQRGAGRTFGRNPDLSEARLTLAQMTSDGVEVAQYAAKHLGQEKVIAFGGSWGSALAVHMLLVRPVLFSAYVGTSQMVSEPENAQASVAKLLVRARADKDTQTVATIEALGAPPWTNPRNFGILRRATRTYERKVTTPAPETWWIPAPDYATPAAQADYEAGEEYSYLQFVGLKGDGMLSQLDLPALGTRFAMPIFLVQGEEDLVTTPELAKAYFDTITAPEKAFVLLPRTGHDPNAAMTAAQYDLLKTRVLPLVK